MKNEQNAPKIRFKGFTDAWELRKLHDLFTERNEQYPTSNDYPLMAFIANVGVASKGERYDRSALVKDEEGKKYKRTEKGDFIYSSNNLETGSIGLNNYGNACISPVYSVFKSKHNADADFLGRILLRKEFIHQMVQYRQGVVYGQWRIHESDFLNLGICVPPLAEQRQIGAYFRTLDHLITLHQRKCETLKKLKKSMLQKMFPKNGSHFPEIRFAGFTDAWELREFSQLYKKVAEKNDLSFGTDKIISVANMYFKADTKESSDDYMKTYNIMRMGDIAFEGNKSKNYAHGRFVENTIGDGIVSHVFDVFRPITDYDLFFWKYMINNEGVMGRIMTRCTKASTMMTNLVADDFLKETISIPSIEEQRQIGAYFRTLDHLITLHQRKLETLKKLKKAMLQKMFI